MSEYQQVLALAAYGSFLIVVWGPLWSRTRVGPHGKRLRLRLGLVLVTWWGGCGAFSTARASHDAGLSPDCFQAADAIIETDRGTRIPAYFCRLAATVSDVPPSGFAGLIIQQADSDCGGNCHGLTFAAGRFWLDDADVDRILLDNGYERITRPAVDDVIVYRDSAGNVVHTGVVKAVGKKGFVLIESKWGTLGRYLHLPEVSVYPDRHEFYHTSRPDHLLRIKP